MDFVSVAQVAAAVGTLILAALTFAYVLFTRSMVAELRETRIAQDRPLVIVDADYSDQSIIDIVVRNIGKGAAKEVTFEFSAPMVSSMSVREDSEASPLNELPYFKEGIDFLAPGAEIRCTWDSYFALLPLLRDRGYEEGISITSRYEDLAGDFAYETKWTINPLRLSGAPHVRRRGMNDLAESVEKIARNFDRVTGFRELRVVTKTEQRQENERLRAQMEAERKEG